MYTSNEAQLIKLLHMATKINVFTQLIAQLIRLIAIEVILLPI